MDFFPLLRGKYLYCAALVCIRRHEFIELTVFPARFLSRIPLDSLVSRVTRTMAQRPSLPGTEQLS